DWPDSVEHARLWIALVGATAALAGVVYAIWVAVQILLPKLVLVGDLAAAWEKPPKPLDSVVAQFKCNIKYLQGFRTPAQIIRAREELVVEQGKPDIATALTWLHEHGTTIEAGYVLPPLLANHSIIDAGPTFLSDVEEWLIRYSTLEDVGFVAKHL